MKIQGTERMSTDRVNFELRRGGKFVLFQYCISLFIITLRRPSDIYFIRSGEGTLRKSLPFTLISLLAAWWGIPWGPIYTVQSLVTNLKGGKDVTQKVIAGLNKSTPQAAPKPTLQAVAAR